MLEEYNQYAYNNKPSRVQSRHDESLSYIDLLNDQDINAKVVGANENAAEETVNPISHHTEQEDSFHLVLNNSNEAPKQFISQLQTLKNDTIEEQENQQRSSSLSSEELQINFQMLADQGLRAGSRQLTSRTDFITEYEDHQRTETDRSPGLTATDADRINNTKFSKQYQSFVSIQNRFHQAQQDHGSSSNNTEAAQAYCDKVKHYKMSARGNSQSLFQQDKFKKLLEQNTQGLEMLKLRKLASPIEGTHIVGDNNDDIPLTMTEEQANNMLKKSAQRLTFKSFEVP